MRIPSYKKSLAFLWNWELEIFLLLLNIQVVFKSWSIWNGLGTKGKEYIVNSHPPWFMCVKMTTRTYLVGFYLIMSFSKLFQD